MKYEIHRKSTLEADRKYALERFKSQNLEPLDEMDPKSPLICWDCMKETARTDRIKNRHYEYCEFYSTEFVPRYPVINFRGENAKAIH